MMVWIFGLQFGCRFWLILLFMGFFFCLECVFGYVYLIFYQNLGVVVYVGFGDYLFVVFLVGFVIYVQGVGWVFEMYCVLFVFVGGQIYQGVGNCCGGVDGYCCCVYYGMVQFVYGQCLYQQVYVGGGYFFIVGCYIVVWVGYECYFGCVLVLFCFFQGLDQFYVQGVVGVQGFEYGQGVGVFVDVVL